MTESSHELEPIATRPALRMFVEAAREQPIAPTRLSAHEVQRAYQQQQRAQQHSRRQLGLGVSLGSLAMAAAAAIAFFVLPSPHAGDDAGTSAVAATPAHVEAARADAATPDAGLASTLDPAIHVASSTEPVHVLGPWTIALRGGEHAIRVEPSSGAAPTNPALRIELPERTLELVHGELDVQIIPQVDAAPFVVVRLESGVAAWIAEDGTRTQIEVERIDVPVPAIVEAAAEVASDEPSAAELARAAEQQLLAGKREDAIGTLRKLVRKFPRTPQARTALLDLARQERLAARPDRARCAYLLYVERWPHSEVRSEIDKQLAKLGEGPACKGLDPR